MSRIIGIEKRRVRQNLTQTFNECTFTRRNSPGDPNYRHKKLSAVEAPVSAAKFPKTSMPTLYYVAAKHRFVIARSLGQSDR
jgi:hypothetical protein